MWSLSFLLRLPCLPTMMDSYASGTVSPNNSSVSCLGHVFYHSKEKQLIQGVTNDFLNGFEAYFTREISCLVLWTREKPMGLRSEPTCSFLNGHVVKLSCNIYVYTHRSVLLSTLAREASLCNGSGQWRQSRLVKELRVSDSEWSATDGTLTSTSPSKA